MASIVSLVVRLLQQIAQSEQGTTRRICTQQPTPNTFLQCKTLSLLNYLQNRFWLTLRALFLQQSIVSSSLSLSPTLLSSSLLMLTESSLLQSPLLVQRREYCNKARRISNTTAAPAASSKQIEKEQREHARNLTKAKKTSRKACLEASDNNSILSNYKVESIPFTIEVVSKEATSTGIDNKDNKCVMPKKVNKLANKKQHHCREVKTNAVEQKQSLSPKKSMHKQLPANNNIINKIIINDNNSGNVAVSHKKIAIVGGSKDNKHTTANADRVLQHAHYDNNAYDKLHITLYELLQRSNVEHLSYLKRAKDDEITDECIFVSTLRKFAPMQRVALVYDVTTPSLKTALHAKQQISLETEQEPLIMERSSEGHSVSEEFVNLLLSGNYTIDTSPNESLTFEEVQKLLQLSYELLFPKRTSYTNDSCEHKIQEQFEKSKRNKQVETLEEEEEEELKNKKGLESPYTTSVRASLLCRLLDIAVEHIVKLEEKYDLSAKSTLHHDDTVKEEKDKLYTLAEYVNFINSIHKSREWREYCKIMADMSLEHLHEEESQAHKKGSKKVEKLNTSNHLSTRDVNLTLENADFIDSNINYENYNDNDDDTRDETFANNKSKNNRKINKMTQVNNSNEKLSVFREQHYYFQLINTHFIQPLIKLYVAKALDANSPKYKVNNNIEPKRTQKKRKNNNSSTSITNKCNEYIGMNVSSGERMLQQFLIVLMLLLSDDFIKTQNYCCDLLKRDNCKSSNTNDVNSQNECKRTKCNEIVNKNTLRNECSKKLNVITARYSEQGKKMLERLLYGLSVDNDNNSSNSKSSEHNCHFIEESLSFLPQTIIMQMREHVGKLKAGLTIVLLGRMFSSYVPGTFLLQWTQQLSSFSHWLCTKWIFLDEHSNFTSSSVNTTDTTLKSITNVTEKGNSVKTENNTNDWFGEMCEEFIDCELALLLKELYVTHRSRNNNLYDQVCTDIFAVAHVFCSPSQLSHERQRRLLELITLKTAHFSTLQNAKNTLPPTIKPTNTMTTTDSKDNINSNTKEHEEILCVTLNHNNHKHVENKGAQSWLEHYPAREMSLRCLFCYTLLLHDYLPDALLSHAVTLFQMHNHSFLQMNANKVLERKQSHTPMREGTNVGGRHDKFTALNNVSSCYDNNVTNRSSSSSSIQNNRDIYNSNYRISTIVEMLILLHDLFSSLHKHRSHIAQASIYESKNNDKTIDSNALAINIYNYSNDVSRNELLSLMRLNYYNKSNELCTLLVTQCCQLFQFVTKTLRQCPLPLSEMLLLESLTQFYDFENHTSVNIESTVSNTSNSNNSTSDVAKGWITNAFTKFETNVLEAGYECATMSLRSIQPQPSCEIDNDNNNNETASISNAETETHAILVSHPQTASSVVEMCSVCLYLAVQSCVELLFSANETNGITNIRLLLTSIFPLVELFSEFGNSNNNSSSTSKSNKHLTCMLHLTCMFKAIWKRYTEYVKCAMYKSTTPVLESFSSTTYMPLTEERAKHIMQECALLFLSRIDEHHAILVNSDEFTELNSHNFFHTEINDSLTDNVVTKISTENNEEEENDWRCGKKDQKEEEGDKLRTSNKHAQNVTSNALSDNNICIPLSMCAKMQMIVNALTLTVLETGVNISTARKTIVLHTNFTKLLDLSLYTKNGSLHVNRQERSLLPSSWVTTSTATIGAAPLWPSVYVNTNKARSTNRWKNESVNRSQTQIVDGLVYQCTSVITLLAHMLNEEELQRCEAETDVMANNKVERYCNIKQVSNYSNNNYNSIMIHEIVAVYLNALKGHMSLLLNELGAIRHIELPQENNSKESVDVNYDDITNVYFTNRMRRIVYVFFSTMKLLSTIDNQFPFTVHYSSAALFMFKREILLPAITLLLEFTQCNNKSCANMNNNAIHNFDNANVVMNEVVKSKSKYKCRRNSKSKLEAKHYIGNGNDAGSTNDHKNNNNSSFLSYSFEELISMMSMICDKAIMHHVPESIFTQIISEVNQYLKNIFHEEMQNATFISTDSLQTITLCIINLLSRDCANLNTLCYDLLKVMLPELQSDAKLLIIVANKLYSLHLSLPPSLEQLIVTNLLKHTELCYKSYTHKNNNTSTLPKSTHESENMKRESLSSCIASLHATSRYILFTVNRQECYDKESDEQEYLISLCRLSSHLIRYMVVEPTEQLPLAVWIELLETTINLSSLYDNKVTHRSRLNDNFIDHEEDDNIINNGSNNNNAYKIVSEFAFVFARCMFSHTISHLSITALDAEKITKKKKNRKLMLEQLSSLSLVNGGVNGDNDSQVNERAQKNKNCNNKESSSENLLVEFASAKSDEIGQLMQRATPQELVMLIKTFTLFGHTNKRAKEIVRRLISPLLTSILHHHELININNNRSENTIRENCKSNVHDKNSRENSNSNVTNNTKINAAGKHSMTSTHSFDTNTLTANNSSANGSVEHLLTPSDILSCVESYVQMRVAHPYLYSLLFAKLADYNHLHRKFTSVFALSLPQSIRLLQCGWRMSKIIISSQTHATKWLLEEEKEYNIANGTRTLPTSHMRKNITNGYKEQQQEESNLEIKESTHSSTHKNIISSSDKSTMTNSISSNVENSHKESESLWKIIQTSCLATATPIFVAHINHVLKTDPLLLYAVPSISPTLLECLASLHNRQNINNFELHHVINSVLQVIMTHMSEIHNDDVIKAILQLLINHSNMTYFTNANQQHQLNRYQRYSANVFGSTGVTAVNTDLSQFTSNYRITNSNNNNLSTNSLVTSRLSVVSQSVDHEVLLRSFIEHVLHHIQQANAASVECGNNNNKNDKSQILRVMHSEMELCELLTQAGKRSSELLGQTLHDRIVSWLTSLSSIPQEEYKEEWEEESLKYKELSENGDTTDNTIRDKTTQMKSDNFEYMSNGNNGLDACKDHLSTSDLMRIARICEQATVMVDDVLIEAFLTQLRLLVNDYLCLYNHKTHQGRRYTLELSQVCSLLHFLHVIGKSHMLLTMQGVDCLLEYVIQTFAIVEQGTCISTKHTSCNTHLESKQCKKSLEPQHQHERFVGKWFNLHGLTLSELHTLLRATIEESATPKHFTVLINSIAFAVYRHLSFIVDSDINENNKIVKNDHLGTWKDNKNKNSVNDNNNKFDNNSNSVTNMNTDVEEFCKRLNLASTVQLFVLFAKVYSQDNECNKLSTNDDTDAAKTPRKITSLSEKSETHNIDTNEICRVLHVLSIVLYTQRSHLLQRHLLLEHVRRAMSGSTEQLWNLINSSLYNLIVGKSLL